MIQNNFLLNILRALLVWVVIIMVVGCAYTGKNDPYIQFSHEGYKDHYQSPRQQYFNNDGIDNYIVSRMCIA